MELKVELAQLQGVSVGHPLEGRLGEAAGLKEELEKVKWADDAVKLLPPSSTAEARGVL